MGSKALKSSIAVASLLRSRRKEFGLTLREVSERLAIWGDSVPPSTLARIEQGKLDPGIRRLHGLLRLYEVPPHLVADLIELEQLAVEQPAGKDLEALYRDGVEYWKQGNVAQGLAYLLAVRQHVPGDEAARVLRQKATLAFAVAARNLGKLKLAREFVNDLLCEPPDSSLIVDALTLASSLWRGFGSREVAMALLREATDHLRPGELQKEAWVLHQKAKLLLETGRTGDAEQALARALALYRELGDTYGEIRASVLRTELLEARGALAEALECAREVLRRAQSQGHAKLAISGRLEVGRLLTAAGSTEEGLAELRQGLAQAVVLGDRSAEFYGHYRLWKAQERLGDAGAARFELETVKHLVRFIDDSSPEANEVRELSRQ